MLIRTFEVISDALLVYVVIGIWLSSYRWSKHHD